MREKIVPLMVFLLVTGLFGCASHEIRALTVEPIAAYQLQQAVAGVTIAADPIDTNERAEALFTIDLTEQGYAPILVVIENRSRDKVLILKDDIELVDSRGNMHKPTPVDVMVEKFEHNKIAYAFLGFGIFSYMSAEEANKKMRRDWNSKELPAEKILLPNRNAHGVVYFELGPGLTTLPNATLKIPFENLRTGQHHSVTLRLATGS